MSLGRLEEFRLEEEANHLWVFKREGMTDGFLAKILELGLFDLYCKMRSKNSEFDAVISGMIDQIKSFQSDKDSLSLQASYDLLVQQSVNLVKNLMADKIQRRVIIGVCKALQEDLAEIEKKFSIKDKKSLQLRALLGGGDPKAERKAEMPNFSELKDEYLMRKKENLLTGDVESSGLAPLLETDEVKVEKKQEASVKVESQPSAFTEFFKSMFSSTDPVTKMLELGKAACDFAHKQIKSPVDEKKLCEKIGSKIAAAEKLALAKIENASEEERFAAREPIIYKVLDECMEQMTQHIHFSQNPYDENGGFKPDVYQLLVDATTDQAKMEKGFSGQYALVAMRYLFDKIHQDSKLQIFEAELVAVDDRPALIRIFLKRAEQKEMKNAQAVARSVRWEQSPHQLANSVIIDAEQNKVYRATELSKNLTWVPSMETGVVEYNAGASLLTDIGLTVSVLRKSYEYVKQQKSARRATVSRVG